MGVGTWCMEGPSTLLGCCKAGSPPGFFGRASPNLAGEEDNTGILIVEGQEGGRGHIKAEDRQGSFGQSLCPVQEDPPLAAAAER